MRGLITVSLALALAVPASAQQSGERPVIVKLETADLITIDGIPECFTALAVRGDPNMGPATWLLKAQSGCAVPWHWHTPNAQVMVVSGTLRLEMKGESAAILGPGDYLFLPARHIHQDMCSVACTFFVQIDAPFDIHYVDDSGNEIPSEQALKVGTN